MGKSAQSTDSNNGHIVTMPAWGYLTDMCHEALHNFLGLLANGCVERSENSGY